MTATATSAAAADAQHPRESEADALVSALEGLVANTEGEAGKGCLGRQHPSHGPYCPAHVSRADHTGWWSSLAHDEGIALGRLDDLFARHHLGNYVAVRHADPPRRVFESMPIAVRLGMHLLFFSSKKRSLLRYRSVEEVLKSLTVRQGKVYDDASDPQAVLAHIKSFIETYAIDTSELLEQDLTRYPTMNSFFYRKLRPDARPVAEPTDPRVVGSNADCRLTVYDDVSEATRVWIKGGQFSVRHLLSDSNVADQALPPGSSLAIFRLAPADYHRFHHPVGPAVCGPTRHCDGEYYTVNPQAVNQDFDVFTSNRRDVLHLDWSPSAQEHHAVALVAIGAMMVGGIAWTAAAQGRTVQRGEEAGYFAYGGSTVIAVFPPSARIAWDEDLRRNSLDGLETIVHVGERIGISKSK